MSGITPFDPHKVYPPYDRSFMNKCSCGNRPWVCTNSDNNSRVSCIKKSGGCGRATLRYGTTSKAVEVWNAKGYK